MTFRRVLIFCVALLSVVGCSTIIPETDEPQAERVAVATLTPTYAVEDGEPVTSSEDLLGIWYSRRAGGYLLFDMDGYFAAARLLEDIHTAPAIQGAFHFDGDTLVMQHDYVDEGMLEYYPDAVGSVNTFTVARFPDGGIRFSEIDLEFVFFGNIMGGEDDLIVNYHRVDV